MIPDEIRGKSEYFGRQDPGLRAAKGMEEPKMSPVMTELGIDIWTNSADGGWVSPRNA